MPAISNLVLTDRAGTPVNHTFTPNGKPNGVARLVKSSGVPVGDWVYSLASNKTATRRKVAIRLVLPVVATQTINGVNSPLVVRTAYANVDFNFDVLSTTQERKDCVGLLMSSLATSATLVDKTVVDLEDVW